MCVCILQTCSRLCQLVSGDDLLSVSGVWRDALHCQTWDHSRSGQYNIFLFKLTLFMFFPTKKSLPVPSGLPPHERTLPYCSVVNIGERSMDERLILLIKTEISIYYMPQSNKQTKQLLWMYLSVKISFLSQQLLLTAVCCTTLAAECWLRGVYCAWSLRALSLQTVFIHLISLYTYKKTEYY